MQIFTPVWKDPKKREKALAWVEKQSGDSEKLLEAAMHSPMQDVGMAAAEKLTDQKLLYKLITAVGLDLYDWKGRNGIQRRNLALQKITDQTILRELAKQGYFCDNSRCAPDRLTDPGTLTEMLTDENFFTAEKQNTYAKTGLLAYALKTVLGTLGLNGALAVAAKLPYRDIAGMLVDRMTADFGMDAAEIAADPAFQPAVRIKAAVLLPDNSALYALARADEREIPLDFRCEAAKQITDQNLLAALIEEEMKRLENIPFTAVTEDAQKLLRAALKNVRDPQIRKRFCSLEGKDSELHTWETVSEREEFGWQGYQRIKNVYWTVRCVNCGIENEKHYFIPVSRSPEEEG